MIDREPLTIEVLGASNGRQPPVLDRVIGATVYIDEAKRIGHHLVKITDGKPNGFRVITQAQQPLYEWHVADKKNH